MSAVPVGMAMGLVGVTGYSYLVGSGPALKLIGQTSMRTVTDYTFGVIPMFLLMGAFVSASGVSRELFRAANSFVGHLRGGLGIAAGGTLGAMLPPSTVLVVYGIITQQDIGKLFVAGILPGLLAISMYMITIALIGVLRPGFLPEGVKSTWQERLAGIREIWAPLALFAFVIGGLYGGLFTPTEAGGMGAGGAFILGVLRRRLARAEIRASLLQATRTAAAVFTVLIGALLFGYFLTITQTPQKIK